MYFLEFLCGQKIRPEQIKPLLFPHLALASPARVVFHLCVVL